MHEQKTTVAILANGCFWCTEAVFKSLKGIKSVIPGYCGGKISNPTYDEVSSGNTGHAESIKIEFDPGIISFEKILLVFFKTHNPTTLNMQGNDIGTQYRSAIFCLNEEQFHIANNLIDDINRSKIFDKNVVTQVIKSGSNNFNGVESFYPAEDYHLNYYANHKDQPYCQLVIGPKLEKLNKEFSELID